MSVGHLVVNSQDVNQMSDGHRNVVMQKLQNLWYGNELYTVLVDGRRYLTVLLCTT